MPGSDQANRFPGWNEVTLPESAAGWKEMYPFHSMFDEFRDDPKIFWIRDSLHFPEPLTAFEADIATQFYPIALSAYQSRVWTLPEVNGVSVRILGGYIYESSRPVPSPAEIAWRERRYHSWIRYYQRNWEVLLESWRKKVRGLQDELRMVSFQDPDIRGNRRRAVTTSGLRSPFDLSENFDKLMLLWRRSWSLHFELSIARSIAARLQLLCKALLPGFTEDDFQSLLPTVTSPLRVPFQRLNLLANHARRFRIEDVIISEQDPAALFDRLRNTSRGRSWILEFERSKDPWFYVGTAPHPGMYNPSRYPAWIDDVGVPLGFIREALISGADCAPNNSSESGRSSRDALRRLNAALSSRANRRKLNRLLEALERTFPYLEEHHWWLENLTWSMTWSKMSELGRLLVDSGILNSRNGIFHLRVDELRSGILDLERAWVERLPPVGAGHWNKMITTREAIFGELCAWQPPRALGIPPEAVVDPAMLTLFGANRDRITEWLQSSASRQVGLTLRGNPGAPGVVEGYVRIVTSIPEAISIAPGDVLVCSSASPMWAPSLNKATAIVTDIGGSVSHLAILCRECHIPAVLGTGSGTASLETGDFVRVDGAAGLVSLLRPAHPNKRPDSGQIA